MSEATKNILIVEDEPDVLKMTAFRLKKAGYEVMTTTDGEKALEMVEKEGPDLIFLDLNLPVIDGYEVCRKLKANNRLKEIPVVILSASADGIKEITAEIGGNDYLIKPYEPEELFAKVDKYLK